MPDYFQIVIPLGFMVPAFAAAFMIPSDDKTIRAPLKPSAWVFGVVLWYIALTINSLEPDKWGWAIVWGSIALGTLLITSWVGFYRLGRNA